MLAEYLKNLSSSSSKIFERLWIWFSILSVGIVLISSLLEKKITEEKTKTHQAILEMSVLDLRDALETELALGLELQDSKRNRDLLGKKLLQNPLLHTLDLVSNSGEIISSTNRSLQGMVLPSLVQDSIAQHRHSDAPWGVSNSEISFYLLPLHNAHGEKAGFAMLTSAPQESAPILGSVLPNSSILLLLLCTFCASFLFLWMLIDWERRNAAMRHTNLQLERAHHYLSDADAKLEESFAKLDALERKP